MLDLFSRMAGSLGRSSQIVGLIILFFLILSPAHSSPQGGTVISGSASIAQSGSATLINQMTKQVIIDWNGFGIGPNELVQFMQPSSFAIALNRVTGVSPSLIYGMLKANGRIFLINPNGILFGPGSEVDVGGLVASTLDISNSDFLSGNYNFSQFPGAPPSSVINQGSIVVSDGGYVTFLAPEVDNEGLIVADSGDVDLLGGTSAVLSLDPSGLVNVAVRSKEGLVSRSIFPAGGGEENAAAEAVNRTDVVNATAASQNGTGGITLSGAAGDVENSGTIEANGASGDVALNSSQETLLAAGSSIEADGGNVSIDSQGQTLFESGASIVAIPDANGSGGTVDISDKTGGSVAGSVAAGTFLIDPTNTFIDSCGASTCVNSSSGMPAPIDTYVATTTLTGASSNVTIQSSNAIGVDEDLGTLTVGGGHSLTLEITPASSGASVFGILFEGSGASVSKIATTGSGALTLCAGVTSCDGGVAAASGTGNITLGNLTTASGAITVAANNNITIGGAISGAAVSLTASTASGAISDPSGSTVTATTDLILEAATGIGTSGAALKTATPELQAYNATSGVINITNTGNVSVDDFSLGTGVGIENGGAGNITITDTGSIDFPGNFTANPNGYSTAILALGGGNIAVTANGASANITSCDGASCTGMASAESYGGSVTFTAGDNISLGIKNYDEISTAFGAATSAGITLNAAGSVTLNNATYLESNNGSISVTGTSISLSDGSEIYTDGTGNVTLDATSGAITVDGTSSVASLGTGSLSLAASGNIALNGSAYIDGASGTITADSTGGSITSTSTNPAFSAQGGVNLTASAGIGASSQNVISQSPSLTVDTTGSGDAAYFSDSSPLTSLSITTNNGAVTMSGLAESGTLGFTGGAGDLLSASFGESSLSSFVFDNTSGNININSAIPAGTGTVSLSASGYIANGPSSGSITANALTLTAAAGIGYNGSSPSAIETSAPAVTLSTTTANTAQINLADSGSLSGLSVTTNNSSVAITASNATGTVSLAGGSGGTDLFNAQFTGSTLASLTLDNTDGNIVLNSANLIDLGTNAASAASLTASGYIANGASSGSITANALTMSAGTYIGAGGSGIATAAGNLTATASGGGIYVSNTGPGALTLSGATATGNAINISNSSGDIAIGGAVSGSTVTLTDTGSITDAGGSTVTGTTSVTLNATTGIGADVATPSLTVAATTANNGGIYASDSSALASLSVTTANGTVSITAPNVTGSVALAGGLGGTDLFDAVFTGTTLTNFSFDNSDGNLVLNSANVVNAGTNAASSASLDASGDIANGASNGSITANTLTMSAGTYIGAGGSSIATVVKNLTASASGGGIYVSNTGPGALTLNGATAAGNAIDISNSSGNLVIGGAVSGADVTLTDTGSLTDASGSTVTGTASVTMSATAGIGASGTPIDVTTPSLTTATTTANTAGIYASDSSALTALSVTTANSTVDITASNVTGSVALAGGAGGTDFLNARFTGSSLTTLSFDNTHGNLVLNSANLVNMGTNAATNGTLTASGYIANGTSVGSITANTLTLTASTGIGYNGTTVSSISTGAPNLTVTTTTANTAEISVADTTSLASLSVTTANSTVAITASNVTGSVALAGGSGGTDYLNAEFTGSTLTNFSFDNTDGDLVLFSTTDIVNLGTGITTGTLTASAYIANGSTAPATAVTAGTLNLEAGTYIGTSGSSLNTDVGTLSAAASNGGIYISNAGALTLNAVTATGNTITISNATGNININGAMSGGAVTLTAAAGSITDTSGSTVTGTTGITLTATTGIGTAANNLVVVTPELTPTTTTLNTAGIYITDQDSGAGALNYLFVETTNSTVDITSSYGSLTFAGGSSGSDLLNAVFTTAGEEMAFLIFYNTDGNVAFNAANVVNDAFSGSLVAVVANAITDTGNSTAAPAINQVGDNTLYLVTLAGNAGVVGSGTWRNPPNSGGSSGWAPIYTSVDNLNAYVADNLVLDNAGSVTEGTIDVGGTAYVIANGNVISGGISAGNGIYLIATGSITDGTNGADVDYQGKSVDLVAGGGIGTPSDPVSVVLTGGGGLDAFAAAGSIYISGASPLSGSSEGVFVSQGGTTDFPSLAQAAIATYENEGLPDGVSLIEASQFYTDAALTSSLIGTGAYYSALSQDNPYQSNDYDSLSEILLQPIDGVMAPLEPILFQDWLETKKKHNRP